MNWQPLLYDPKSINGRYDLLQADWFIVTRLWRVWTTCAQLKLRMTETAGNSRTKGSEILLLPLLLLASQLAYGAPTRKGENYLLEAKVAEDLEDIALRPDYPLIWSRTAMKTSLNGKSGSGKRRHPLEYRSCLGVALRRGWKKQVRSMKNIRFERKSRVLRSYSHLLLKVGIS